MAPKPSVLLAAMVATAVGPAVAADPAALCGSSSDPAGACASDGQELSSLLQRPSEERQGGSSAAQVRADIDPGYAAQAALVQTHGSCAYPITSLANCNAAALSTPEVPNVAAHSQSASDRPYGCWWQPSNGMLFFNSAHTSVKCSQALQCLCQKPANPPQPGDAFTEQKYGVCGSPINSAAQCQTGVIAISSIPTVEVQTQSVWDRPYGCWYQPQNNMAFFNSNTASTTACSADRPCVCSSASPYF